MITQKKANSGQATTADIEKEKAAVSERLDQWFQAAQDEDVGMLENILCDDAELLIFGTDANERWMGKNDFIAAQKEFFKVTSDSKIEIYNKTIQFSQSGTVAWTSCMMNLNITSVDHPLHLKDLRFTSTFEKRDGRWVMVQGHGSVPVSGQMIAY